VNDRSTRVRALTEKRNMTVVRAERRTKFLHTLELNVGRGWQGRVTVSGPRNREWEVLIGHYESAAEVNALSRLGLKYVGSEDGLVRYEAQRLLELVVCNRNSEHIFARLDAAGCVTPPLSIADTRQSSCLASDAKSHKYMSRISVTHHQEARMHCRKRVARLSGTSSESRADGSWCG
jgi:hypothetical protein